MCGEFAVNYKQGDYLRILPLFTPWLFPVSRGIPDRFFRAGCPPLFLLTGVSPGRRAGSTRGSRFSDEPFGVRDIQFNRPEILVEPCTLSEELGNFDGTRRFGGPRPLPEVATLERKNALQAGKMRPFAGDQENNGAPLRVALPKHGPETATRLGSTQDPGNFEMRGKTIEAQAGPIRRRRARRRPGEPRRAHRYCGHRASSRVWPRGA